MYLGEIHSPFNKQKLVEELGAFLRKEENRQTIVNLLSESDILILAAVYYIPNATSEKLAAFFDSTIKFARLYERLLNLEERQKDLSFEPILIICIIVFCNTLIQEILPYIFF